MAGTTDLITYDGTTTALVPHAPALPSIAEIKHTMQWMAEFRPLLLEYIEQQMDPARHLYTFDNNRYTRITDRTMLKALLAKGQKPALNQDGMHNLLALFACDVEDQRIEEHREDGHYTCRVLVWFRYWGAHRVLGMGSCTTRESKYAYRWVYDRDVPKGVDKAALKSRVFEPEGRRPYTRYRLDNEDLADVEATVLQMAFKRAKSAAVKSLPGVSEMFAEIGDPGELTDEDSEREEVLAQLRQWLRGMRAAIQPKALLAVFGEPLRANDVPKLELDRLVQAAQIIEIATRAGIQWASVTLVADLKQALAASATQAQVDVFGEALDPTAPAGRPSTTAAAPHRDTNGSWRENAERLAATLPDALTPHHGPALTTRVQEACERALGLCKNPSTPASEGEAMLERLRTLSDEVSRQPHEDEYGNDA